ncbi:MAG: DUF1573 domain-containing protein [Candidatus Doudnabacteria bacterium]
MSKKLTLIIGVAVGIVGLGLLLIYVEPKEGESIKTANPSNIQMTQLKSDLSDYDFGTISMKNGKVTKSFKITNVENTPVMVKKVYTSCMCTDAMLRIGSQSFGPYGMLSHGFSPEVNQAIQPNQDATIDVTFDPNAHGPSGIGVIERVVSVEQADGSKLTLNIKANVTP